jgi:hypothetical protein
MMASSDNDIQIEYDEEVQSYYIVWRPVVAVGMGKTEKDALEELRAVAHLGIDTVVDLKQREIVGEEGYGHGEQS